MIRELRITVVVEEVGGAEPGVCIVQTRKSHFVSEQALHIARFPGDWLRAELEIPLKRSSADVAPVVLRHIAPTLLQETK